MRAAIRWRTRLAWTRRWRPSAVRGPQRPERDADEGAAALGIVADAASREDCERLVNTAREHFGRIDILVNNAGMTHDQLLVRMTDEDWDRVMEVNLRAAFLMTRAVTKALVRGKRGGRIIN